MIIINNLHEKAINGVAWSLIDKIINQTGNIVLLIYLSQVLSPSDFGLIAMLAIFLAIAQSLIDSGFSQALIQKSGKVTEVDFSTVFYVNLTVSFFLYFVLYILAPSIADFYHQPELIDLSRLLFIAVIVNAIAIVPRSKLLISIDFKSQGLINSASMIVSSAVSIYMVNNEYGYWSLVGMSLSKALVNSLLLIIFSKWYPRLVFSKDSFRELFSFGSKLLVAGVLGTILQNLYSILIGRYFKVEQVGYFQQGHKFTDILSSTLSATIQGVTYPLMTSIQEDKTRLIQVYIKVMGIIMLVTFPVFFGFAAVSEEFVLVFLGEKWRPIIPVLVILCFARLITPISALNMNILNARGRSDLFLKTDLYKIPIIIVALFIAIPYGIVGVAFAQLFCVSISFFINAYYPGKLFGFGATEQLKQIIPIGIASLIMYLSMVMITIDNLGIQMATKIIVGVGVYTAFCWAFKITAFRDGVKLTLSLFK